MSQHPTSGNQGQKPPTLRPYQLLTHHLMERLVRLWFRLYARWQVIGLENVPRNGPILFAANHASYLDPLLGSAAIYGTRRMWGVAKVELWRHPVAAYLMDCLYSIPVQRHTADRAMIRRVLDLLAQGETVGIFPEGTRTTDGRLQPAEPGLALLVQKSGAPVVPVALMGTYEMLPRNSKKLRRVPLKVAIGKPILFPPGASRTEILTGIMAAIADLLTANGHPTEPPQIPAPDKLAPDRTAAPPREAVAAAETATQG
jgi:1-acyl-sn-glycerol-3-phosphate acyltransferase